MLKSCCFFTFSAVGLANIGRPFLQLSYNARRRNAAIFLVAANKKSVDTHEVSKQMPIYDYRCQACGATQEALQKISDPDLTDCASCGKSELKKQISAAGFRLAGSGWYETDFKTGNKKNIAGDGGSSACSE